MQLNQIEIEVIRVVLEEYLPQLRDQISNTEQYELRQALKQREEVIKQMLQRIGGANPTQSSSQTMR